MVQEAWCRMMKLLTIGAAKRLILSLLLGSAMTGCAVYAPPYAASVPYSSYPYNYGYAAPLYASPVYVGPPVSLSLGFGFYRGFGGGFGGYHHGGRFRGGRGRWR
jgi:hypothetical protein